MEHRADVVVIGGGIVGGACAYFLAEEGAKVIILERDALGSGASGHGAGAFGVPLHWAEPLEHALFLRKAVKQLKWTAPRVAEEAGIDIMMREMPWMEVARTEPTWEYMQEWAPKMGQRMLDGDEILRLEPRLAPPIIGGVVEEGTGQLDSYRLNLAYAKCAENRGGKVVIAEATGLERTGGKVTGVTTSNGTIGCDSVVLAMGAWTGLAEKWLDFPMPIGPLKGELLSLKYNEKEYWPYWVASYETTDGQELPVYVHMRADGIVYAGTTAEPDTWDNIPTEEARNGIMGRAVRLMPCLAESELVAHVGGPRPNPLDGKSVVGPVPGWDGVYAAVTLPGILCSAFLGRLITEMIFDLPSSTPVESLSPKRFSEPLKEQYGYQRLLADRSI